MRKSSEDKEEEKKKKTPQEVAEKMQILDHNLKAYKALIKSFKKTNRAWLDLGLPAYFSSFALLLFCCFEWSVEKVKWGRVVWISNKREEDGKDKRKED